MKKLFRKVFSLDVNRVKNVTTEMYCKLIMKGNTHDKAIAKLERTIAMMQEEVAHIKGTGK